MKVSTLVLSALLSYSLNAPAQSTPKEKGKPKTAQNQKEKKEVKAKAKSNPLDSTLKARPKRESDPGYCPACGMG